MGSNERHETMESPPILNEISDETITCMATHADQESANKLANLFASREQIQKFIRKKENGK